MAETQIDDPTQIRQGAERLMDVVRLPWKRELQDQLQVDNLLWRVYIDAVWPSAETAEAVILAIKYCRAKRYDPLLRFVHIVPIYSTVRKGMVESVWPGIAAHRATAHRTQEYVGRKFIMGPLMDEFPTDGDPMKRVPEWYQCNVKRLVAGQERLFEGERVYFEEAYARANRNTDSPNAMWFKRPHGQLQKCAEAASLRGAFPEEIGGEYVSEEMEGKEVATLAGAVVGNELAAKPDQPQIEDRRPIVVQSEPKQPDTISANLGVNEQPKESAQQGDAAPLTAHTGKAKPAGSAARKKGAQSAQEKKDEGVADDPPPVDRDERAGDPPPETPSPPPPVAQHGPASQDEFTDLLNGNI